MTSAHRLRACADMAETTRPNLAEEYRRMARDCESMERIFGHGAGDRLYLHWSKEIAQRNGVDE